jgi:hypothetical protein
VKRPRSGADALRIDGAPTGATRRGDWRAAVAVAAEGRLLGPDVRLAFSLRPGRWVDLDTLVAETVRGLRAAAALPYLDGLVATKTDGRPGCTASTITVARTRAPGPAALDARAAEAPRPGDRAARRAWRGVLAASWGGRAPLEGAVWADVEVGGRGALLARLEPLLDALEPVLGRDPRGRAWQEFFPQDDRIVWLRVRRAGDAGGARLRVGPATRTGHSDRQGGAPQGSRAGGG